MNDSVLLLMAAAMLTWLLTGSAEADTRHEVALSVAPNGDDHWSGRLPQPNAAKTDGPLATLAGARDAVRHLKAVGPLPHPVRVAIASGVYPLSAPVVFTSQDSGTTSCPITYEAASEPGTSNAKPQTAVLSGGRRITGWKPTEGGLWTAEIPEVRSGAWYFRQLVVNGKRRRRAHLPKEGMYPLAGGADPQDRAFQFRPGDILGTWTNLGDVEVVVLQYWMEARLPISKVDDAAHTVTCTGGSWRPLTWSRGYYVDNVAEALGTPGEWYLNRKTGLLSYCPLPEENMTKAEVIAPVTEQLVRLQGDPATGTLVHDLAFRGLTFAHSAWTIPETGHAYPQAELPPPSAILAVGAAACAIEDCRFEHTGAWGVEFGRGCKNNRIVGCRFADIGAGGIKIGEPTNAERDADEASGTVITDNTLTEGCQTYLGSPAIWIGQSAHNLVAHNEVTGSWMWAISVGWNWDYMPPNRARDNIVEYNHLHDLGTGTLGMHGAIYGLGVSPGTVIRHNLIHDLKSEPLTSDGIILDNGCGAILVEDNVVHHAGRVSFCFNFNCLGNVIQNNVFALAGSAEINRYGDPPTAGIIPPPNANFWYRNLCYLKTGKVYIEEQWPNFETVCDYNLYWASGGEPVKFLTFGFDEWKAKRLDTHSVVADPLFVAPDKGDFGLRPESPALKLGFRPIDLSGVGPRARR